MSRNRFQKQKRSFAPLRELLLPAALFALVLAAVTGEEAEAVQRRFRRARDEV